MCVCRCVGGEVWMCDYEVYGQTIPTVRWNIELLKPQSFYHKHIPTQYCIIRAAGVNHVSTPSDNGTLSSLVPRLSRFPELGSTLTPPHIEIVCTLALFTHL